MKTNIDELFYDLDGIVITEVSGLMHLMLEAVSVNADYIDLENIIGGHISYELYDSLEGTNTREKVNKLLDKIDSTLDKTESLTAEIGTNLNKNEVQSKIETNTKSSRGEAIKLRRESIKIASGERFVGNEIKVVTRRGKIGNFKVSPSAISSKNY